MIDDVVGCSGDRIAFELLLTPVHLKQAIKAAQPSWAFCENCLRVRVFQRVRVDVHGCTNIAGAYVHGWTVLEQRRSSCRGSARAMPSQHGGCADLMGTPAF